ncbi:hypothetical protein LAZ67_19001587 [Cordylochernes scorpioides]|uniref:Reverse transcriptase domain-containing protein n=1 Tax=Cordylochernes scorpioides TaxID=51811 RepID=A0ABY6LKE9_9ARAC|nr:hypothetical protein LAZ67_19001587 [Cordylochernes scorpioides]
MDTEIDNSQMTVLRKEKIFKGETPMTELPMAETIFLLPDSKREFDNDETSMCGSETSMTSSQLDKELDYYETGPNPRVEKAIADISKRTGHSREIKIKEQLEKYPDLGQDIPLYLEKLIELRKPKGRDPSEFSSITITGNHHELLVMRNFTRNPRADDSITLNDIVTYTNSFPRFDIVFNFDEQHFITKDDIINAIKHLSNKKMAGEDKIPAEFYKKYPNDAADLLLAIFTNAQEEDELPEHMRLGKLILLPKKPSSKTLGEWRPITMMNTDYKILSKLLLAKLKPYSPRIVPIEQKYAIMNRSIFDILPDIEHSVYAANLLNTPLAIVVLDLQRAFDSLNRNFLIATLERIGIPNIFIKWIKIILNNSAIKIDVNEETSPSIQVTRGVRQGCGLSAVLFSISTTALIFQLRDKLSSTTTTHVYADDLVFLIRDESDFDRIYSCLQDFKRVSGININFGKSKGLWCGSWGNRTDTPKEINMRRDQIKVLGILVENSKTPFKTEKENLREEFRQAQPKLLKCLIKHSPNDAPKRTTVSEWHSRFKAGRISIEDDPRQGRPKFQRTDENVQKITDLIKENPRTTLLELEQDTGISKTTIGRIVTEDLKLKKTPAKCIPRFFTNEQKLCRLATCEDMMEMTRTDPEWKDKIITGDETWVYGYDPETKPQSAEWRGPKIQQDLFHIILRFRIHPVAINADIAKMYRQIRISQEDSEFQIIVWRNDPHDKIKDYRLETVTYGTSCAPFLATRIIKQLALDEQITGTFSADEGKNLVQELYGLLSAGGFELRKWTSNVPDVLSLLPNHLRSTNTNIGFEESKEFVNVLGLQWQPRTNGFTFNGIALPLYSMTKRGILSQFAKIIDPLGWISPFTTIIKLILQELWKTGLEWDDPIPEELRKKLTLINQDLPSLEHIQIPRCVVPGNFMKVEFNGFCDAPQKAYAASLYSVSKGDPLKHKR